MATHSFQMSDRENVKCQDSRIFHKAVALPLDFVSDWLLNILPFSNLVLNPNIAMKMSDTQPNKNVELRFMTKYGRGAADTSQKLLLLVF